MSDLLVRRAGLAAVLSLLLLAAAFAYRPIVREMTLPQELSLAPSDASVVVFLPSFDELARKVHTHVCAYDGTGSNGCPFVASSEESENPQPFLAYRLLVELQNRGVDTAQPAMLALRGPITAGDFVLALTVEPETGCGDMQTFLEETAELEFEFGDRDLCEVSPDHAPNGQGALQLQQNTDVDGNEIAENSLPLFVKTFHSSAGGNRRLVVFYTNQAVLTAVRTRKGGSHLLSQDGFAEAYRTIVQGKKPAVWGYARQPGFAPFAPSAFSLTFTDPEPGFMPDAVREQGRQALAGAIAQYLMDASPDESEEAIEARARRLAEEVSLVEGAQSVRLSLWTAPSVLYSRNLSDLMSAQPSERAVPYPQDHGAGISVQAGRLLDYLRFADYAFPRSLPVMLFHEQDEGLGEQASIFETLLREVMLLESVDGVDVQLAGLQDRVPNVLIRLAMSEAEAERLVRILQASEQRRRDTLLMNAVLNRALDTRIEPAEARSLIDTRRIRSEGVPGGFSHVLSSGDRAAFEAAVADDQLNTGCLPEQLGQPYTADVCPEGRRFSYLQPPLNQDDLDLRIARQDDADPQTVKASLLEDQRFRAVSAYNAESSTLWIATDRSVLAEHFGRPPPVREQGRPWLRMSVRPENLYTQMRAQGFDQTSDNDETPENESLARLAQAADALSVYDQITLSAESLGENRGTRIDLEFAH